MSFIKWYQRTCMKSIQWSVVTITVTYKMSILEDGGDAMKATSQN